MWVRVKWQTDLVWSTSAIFLFVYLVANVFTVVTINIYKAALMLLKLNNLFVFVFVPHIVLPDLKYNKRIAFKSC